MKTFFLGLLVLLFVQNSKSATFPSDPDFDNCVNQRNENFVRPTIANNGFLEIIPDYLPQRNGSPASFVLRYGSYTDSTKQYTLLGSTVCVHSYNQPSDADGGGNGEFGGSSAAHASENPSKNLCRGSIINYRERTVS